MGANGFRRSNLSRGCWLIQQNTANHLRPRVRFLPASEDPTRANRLVHRCLGALYMGHNCSLTWQPYGYDALFLVGEDLPIPHSSIHCCPCGVAMSSSQIPNLLTSRRGPRLRGRGGGIGHGHVGASASSRRDQSIQATDTDAAVSRLSAVALGYLDDPFAQYFVDGSGTRRLPLINRGVYQATSRAVASSS
jgi:hypothetical protein